MSEIYKSKRANAQKDYKFDLAALTNGTGASNTLKSGETVDTVVVTVPNGIDLITSSITDSGKSITVWIAGGTVGKTYRLVIKYTTTSSPPRKDEIIFVIRVT